MKKARLAIEVQPTGNPKPTAVGILIDDKPTAWVEIEEVRRVLKQIDEMEARRGRG